MLLIKDRKSKNAFLDSIMNDRRAIVLHKANGHKTTLFPGSKGPKTRTWRQTKQMAFELNDAGFDVTFLSEINGVVCADSLLKSGKTYRLVDFKYCVTTNANTLAKELEHGFEQAKTIVLKLKNMDSGVFKDAIDYLLRNEIPYGSIILMNKYGKVIELMRKDLKTGIFRKALKGFL